ncbi:MAG TPA: DUF2934 domain-containing protein [Candidatus Sulfotelmatobacter sp.]|nr:DUF2934 domain-containing protein [Candidatus Sulfotelmatobacter sp.]
MAKPRGPRKQNGEAAAATVQSTPAALPTDVTETIAAEPIKSLRKPSIVKSEPRSNVLPINLEDEIRRQAYLLAERRGFEPGHEAEDWIAAEREVRQRYHQQSA